MNTRRLIRRALTVALSVLLVLVTLAAVRVFPEDPLSYRLEIAPGADLTADPATYVWTDITADLYLSDPIENQCGADDEQSETNSSLSFTLRDNAGRYVTDNPQSDLYPYFDLDLPIRFSVNTGDGSGWHQRAVQYLAGADDDWPSMTPNLKLTHVVAGGSFRRFGQGHAIKSPLRRNSVAVGPVVYWPMEDGPRATRIAADVGPDMTFTGDAGTARADPGPPGSYPLVSPQPGSVISSPPFAMPAGYNYSANVVPWSFGFAFKAPKIEPFADETLIEWTATGTAVLWRIVLTTGGYIKTLAYDSVGTELLADSGFLFSDDALPGGDPSWYDRWVWMEFYPTSDYPSAGKSFLNAIWTVIAESSDISTSGVYSRGDTEILDTYAQPPTSYKIYGTGETSTSYGIGHLGLYPFYSGLQADAFMGFVGEQAHDRVARVCAEEGIPVSVTATESTAMGSQPTDSLLKVLRDCASTDHGPLDDSRGVVEYTALNELYNAAPVLTLDGADRQLFGPYAPKRDDQGRRNVVRASRPGGSNAEYRDPTVDPESTHYDPSQGVYDGDITVNVQTDGQLLDHASAAVVIGTVPGKRYPTLRLDFLRSPAQVAPWLGLRLGDRLVIRNPPRQSARGDVELQIRGWSETWLGRRQWTATINAVRADPYDVFVIEGAANLGRLDSDSSTLAAAYSETDASFSVATTGTLPTQSSVTPGDFPFDLEVAGEQVTVTAITGAASPQTFAVTRSVNGVRKRQASGTTVALWRGRGLAL